MYANSISRALAISAAATLTVAAHAADQDSTPQFTSFALSLETPPNEPLFFWDHFDYAFEEDVNDVFVDALNPINSIRWNLEAPGPVFSNHFYRRTSEASRGAMLDSFTYSSREAAVEMPAMFWLDDHQGWLADLIRDSVGNVAEESIAASSPSFRAVEQSWWRTLLKGDGTYYGVRPLRTSPYAYIGRSVRDGGNNVVFLANVRYYYDRYSQHRFELAGSIPLAYGLSIDMGSSYQFGTYDDRRFSVKLLKELKGGGIAHIGFEEHQHPTMIAGITFVW